jgi:multiple sugar transport system substrate-binding protein
MSPSDRGRAFSRRSLIRTAAALPAVGALASVTDAVAAPKRSSFPAPALHFQGQTEISLYGWYTISVPVLTKIIESFQAENPTIKVNMTIPSQYIMDQLKVEFAAGAGPDLTCMNTPSGVPWIGKGAFLPLTDVLAADADFAANIEALLPWTREAYTQEGVLYGVPLTAESTAVFYNADLVAAAGLPDFAAIDDDPEQWNWDKLVEYATAVNKGEDDGPDRIYGIHSLSEVQTQWGNFAYGNDGEFLSPDGMTCNIAQPGAAQAIQYLYDLRFVHNVAAPHDPIVAGSGLSALELYQSGRVAILPWGEWQIDGFNQFNEGAGLPFNWNIAQQPFAPTGKRGAVSHSVAMVVNKNSGKQTEAFEFLKFMAREENQLLISTEGWGALSAHPNTYDAWVNDTSKPPLNRAAIIKSHDYNRLYPTCPVLETAEVQDPLNSILYEQVYFGEGDLQEALQEIEDATNDLIEMAGI